MKKQLLAMIFCGLVVFVACKRENEKKEAPEVYNAALKKADGSVRGNSVLNTTNMLVAAPEK